MKNSDKEDILKAIRNLNGKLNKIEDHFNNIEKKLNFIFEKIKITNIDNDKYESQPKTMSD